MTQQHKYYLVTFDEIQRAKDPLSKQEAGPMVAPNGSVITWAPPAMPSAALM
jgi:hypothetical protein